MKKRTCVAWGWTALLMALCLACTAMGAQAGFFEFSASEPEEAEAGQNAGEMPGEVVWTYPIAPEILEDPLDVMRLVNTNNQLDSDYPPPDDPLYELVDATVKKTKNSEMKVRTVVNEALEAMFAAAEADGMSLRLHSAYRSHYTQAVMHENYIERTGKDDGVVQKPGASDHQTGLGVDIINPAWAEKERLNTDFADTAEAQWMAAHCAEYGFVIRYPDGKTDITGIMYEPWHLRYVGVEVARYMTDERLTLEEFTAQWRDAVGQYMMQGGTGNYQFKF